MDKMKLAEALLQRSEYQKKIDNLSQRILANLKVQENDQPYENPEELLAEAMKANDELCALVQRINRRNTEVQLPNGRTIAEGLAERDMLMKKIQLFSAMANHAGQRDYRISRAEVKMCVTMDVGDIQKKMDALSQEHRRLDTMIQGQNWLVDLD